MVRMGLGTDAGTSRWADRAGNSAAPLHFQTDIEAVWYSPHCDFSERDYNVFEEFLGAKVIMNNVLIKLVVPKKKVSERLEKIAQRKYLPHKEQGCATP